MPNTYEINYDSLQGYMEELNSLIGQNEQAKKRFNYISGLINSGGCKVTSTGDTFDNIKELLKALVEAQTAVDELFVSSVTFFDQFVTVVKENDAEDASQIQGTNSSSKERDETARDDKKTAEFERTVEELKKKDGFKQGDYWGYGSHYNGSYKGYYINAWSCCAKAKQMQIEVTGKLGGRTGITDSSQIKPGDVIHYYYPGTYIYDGKEYPNEHWVFVIAVDGDKISIGEGNGYDSISKCNERVNYRDIDIGELNNIKSIYR